MDAYHFDYYGVKLRSKPIYGNGMCCIIVNFTGDLKGYIKDAESIANFHRKTLEWEQVFKDEFHHDGKRYPMTNVTRSQFMELLQAIQSRLQAEETIDRFFLYILSHGDENGIRMCVNESDFLEEEDKPYHPVTVQMEDVTNMFTHDKVKSLKSFPKVFVNQSCKGKEILKSAKDKSHQQVEQVPIMKPVQHNVALGADILVFDASSNNARCYVPEKGSIFIQALLNQMGRFFKKEHLSEILTRVNRQVSQECSKTPQEDNKTVNAFQMPCIHNQLTMKFFLAIPEGSKSCVEKKKTSHTQERAENKKTTKLKVFSPD